MKMFTGDVVPIKSWCGNPEDGALLQAKNLASLPFVFRHVALMPDTHQGFGMPIGGVLATENVVIPNAVGVDIGCGMIACQTSLMELAPEKLKVILGKIREEIPVGFKHRDTPILEPMQLLAELGSVDEHCTVVASQIQSAAHQLGTLGGGNHFIEIQQAEDGHVWVMIHSGSRNLGKRVADHYNHMAVTLNERWYADVPSEWELAFLPIDSVDGLAYFREMRACLKFAWLNRKVMLDRIVNIMIDETKCCFDIPVHIHHNYAALEKHFGKYVMVHRKGATSAREGEPGIIPGSQGTSSYIVRGKGCRDSFMSCSHGAGRRMGRKQAVRELDLAAEQARMEGIVHSVRNVYDLEEAPGAYKDIDVVMAEQQDLVEIVTKLRPLGVVKG